MAVAVFSTFIRGDLFVYSADSNDKALEALFQNPGKEYRPLQIIHGFDGLIAPKYRKALDKNLMDELFQIATGIPTDSPDLKSALKQSLGELKDSGLGGVVCNVSFHDYMRDSNQWKLFQQGLETCKGLDLRVWIYDEDGYPSGAAGGLVLEKNPAFEAQELIFDPHVEKQYCIRPSYEGTHASNNYYAARRYANLIDADACRTFIEVTHGAYAKIAEAEFGKMVEAFFTDEPSLMACNLGQIPEEARKNVPVRDAVDPGITRQPAVPWVHDLPELFQKKYGYEITARIAGLFQGSEAEDKRVRRDFWALVSELLEMRYFGAIQEWCGQHHIASSGHALWEESLLYHPALNGNILRNLQRMHIPGIDVLSSNPGNAFGGYAVTAALASSAARLNGTRRVMTEVSDFSEQMSQKRSASLDEMCATAAWQYALGVTDFTLYYSRTRPADEYRRYGDYTGRLGALLTPAKRIARVAFYYPIYDLWSWYVPEAGRLSLESQPEIVQNIVRSFSDVSSQLVRGGVSFCYLDHNHLAQAKVQGKQLSLSMNSFDALMIPAVDEIPAEAQKVIEAFQAAGGMVIRTPDNPGWIEEIQALNRYQVTTGQPGGLWSEFKRDGSIILLLVNTTAAKWNAEIKTPPFQHLSRWDFAQGSVTEISKEDWQDSRMKIELKPYESIALRGKP